MLSKLEGQCKVCSYLTYLNIIISWPYKPRQNPFLQNWIWCIYIFVILFIQFLQRGGRNRSSWIFGTSSYENDMQKRKWTLLFIYFNIALLSLLSYHWRCQLLPLLSILFRILLWTCSEMIEDILLGTLRLHQIASSLSPFLNLSLKTGHFVSHLI